MFNILFNILEYLYIADQKFLPSWRTIMKTNQSIHRVTQKHGHTDYNFSNEISEYAVFCLVYINNFAPIC